MHLSNTARKVLTRKYYQPGEDFEDLCFRVANTIAQTQEDYEFWLSKYMSLMLNRWFLPAGRILANAGTSNGHLYNCHFFDLKDSRSSIYLALKRAADIFAHGGGVGYNVSSIREKGAPVSNGSEASGPVSFLGLFDYSAEIISQASRRGAQIAILEVDHPDILDFIWAKKDNGRLSHFNISVGITDDFMRAVENDETWVLKSRHGQEDKTIGARELFNEIAYAAWTSGDPGLVFMHRLEEDNAAPHACTINGTNPCLFKDTLMLQGGTLVKISEKKNAWKTGVKDTIKLTTNAGHEIILTPEHKLMLENGDFVCAKDSFGKKLKWGLGNRSSDALDEDQVMRGFLFGDGYRCGGGYGVSVKLSRDREKDIFDFLLSKGFHQQKSGALYKNKDEFGIDVEFLNYRVYERDLPEDVLYADSNKVKSFLRGLFEANGSVNKRSQISLKATNKKMLRMVQILLASFGIESWICVNPPHEVEWDNGTYMSKESYNLQIAPRNAYKFKEKVGFFSNRKNKRIRYLSGTYNSKLRVDKIEKAGRREVWDFTNEPHYDFANGFVAHNCSELPLSDKGACCLGSINLVKMLSETEEGLVLDENKLAYATTVGVTFLDSVHDANKAVLPFIKTSTERFRRIGLGVMGWADTLTLLGISYASERAIELAKEISSSMKRVAFWTSKHLAEKQQPYQEYSPEKSINIWYPDQAVTPTRNATLLSVAPTGSISLVADVNSGIEPFFALAYTKVVTEGEGKEKYRIKEVNKYVEPYLDRQDISEGKKQEIIDKVKSTGSADVAYTEEFRNIFKCAHEIDPKAHIRMQAAWQDNVDAGISKTVNLPNDATVEDVKEVFHLGYELGVKGLTVFRDGCRDMQIMQK